VSAPTVLVHRDEETLAQAVAARLITRIVDAQVGGRSAHVVLTGGGMGRRSLAAVAASPARPAVDWAALHLWWGDERYLPAGDPERNDTQADAALLDAVPVDPGRVHRMAASDGPFGRDVDAAAAAYADDLATETRPEDHGSVPSFDVLMLGVGEEGHIASLFPEMPALYDERAVVGVHGSPKPPPTRISLTLPSIRAAREVWLITAGEAKAAAVRMALSGAGPMQVPAAGAIGRQRTLWLLDRTAASQLPAGLARLASP
jgi:6-phosphogluconolactonase